MPCMIYSTVNIKQCKSKIKRTKLIVKGVFHLALQKAQRHSYWHKLQKWHRFKTQKTMWTKKRICAFCSNCAATTKSLWRSVKKIIFPTQWWWSALLRHRFNLERHWRTQSEAKIASQKQQNSQLGRLEVWRGKQRKVPQEDKLWGGK